MGILISELSNEAFSDLCNALEENYIKYECKKGQAVNTFCVRLYTNEVYIIAKGGLVEIYDNSDNTLVYTLTLSEYLDITIR